MIPSSCGRSDRIPTDRPGVHQRSVTRRPSRTGSNEDRRKTGLFRHGTSHVEAGNTAKSGRFASPSRTGTFIGAPGSTDMNESDGGERFPPMIYTGRIREVFLLDGRYCSPGGMPMHLDRMTSDSGYAAGLRAAVTRTFFGALHLRQFCRTEVILTVVRWSPDRR